MSQTVVEETRIARFDFRDQAGRPATVNINDQDVDHYERKFKPGIPDESIAFWWASVAASQGRVCGFKKTESTQERVTFTVIVEANKTVIGGVY